MSESCFYVNRMLLDHASVFKIKQIYKWKLQKNLKTKLNFTVDSGDLEPTQTHWGSFIIKPFIIRNLCYNPLLKKIGLIQN